MLTSTHAPPTDQSGPYFGSSSLSEPGFRGHVGEGAVAVVVVERVAMNAADEDVLVAVVVVVANGHAGIVAGAREARFLGDVLEGAVAVVVKQAVGVFRRSLLKGLDIGAVGEEDIQLAVVVVVEDGDAAGHRLGRVALRGFAAIQREGNGTERKMDGRGGLLLRSRPAGKQCQDTRQQNNERISAVKAPLGRAGTLHPHWGHSTICYETDFQFPASPDRRLLCALRRRRHATNPNASGSPPDHPLAQFQVL